LGVDKDYCSNIEIDENDKISEIITESDDLKLKAIDFNLASGKKASFGP